MRSQESKPELSCDVLSPATASKWFGHATGSGSGLRRNTQPKRISFRPIHVAHHIPADVQSGVAPLLKPFLPCSFILEMLRRGLRLDACR